MHGYIIDLVRGDTLVEIQTGNFSAIRKKLIHLVQRERVLLVYPIPKEKILITEISEEKQTKRKSPKKGDIWMLFKELIRIPEIINHPNLSIEVVFVKIEEIKIKDGKGSWRRKGDSILDRRLLQVFSKKRFEEPVDFLNVLPIGLSTNFSCRDLSKKADIDINTARKAVYCLKKMNALDVAFKEGNELYYIISHEVFSEEPPY